MELSALQLPLTGHNRVDGLAALKRVLAELVLPGTCGLVAHPCGYRHKARYIAMKLRWGSGDVNVVGGPRVNLPPGLCACRDDEMQVLRLPSLCFGRSG
jgi:hypothetical protein